MTNIVGIDLGTTNSLVAVAPTGRPPAVVVNAAGANLTPSVVLFGADQTLVGGDAKRAAKRSPDDYVEFVKRQMGDPHWQFVDTHDREHRPEEISGLILNKLAADASAMLGSPVKDAVITVPAYFDDIRRKATRDAGTIGGLTVHRLINEPTAAAIAFGVDRLATGVVFVFDLGGGTFDVTVMRAATDDFEVIATDGDRNLGGFDFDNALMLHAVDRILAEGGPDVRDDSRAEYDLRAQCVEAKHQLSTQDQASIYMTLGDRNFTVTVTRAEFERITRELLDRTEVLAEGVLEDAHLTWPEVDHLLLVGGSTRMPMVRTMIERISGKKPAAGVNPDEAVALGAAIIAATIEASQRGEPAAVSYSDATSKSMGIVAVDVDRNYLEYNSIIIAHNHRVPAREENVYRTLEHSQHRLNVRVTEGDEESLEHTNILAEQMVTLPPGLPKGAPLKVIMSYSIDQMINVVVIDLTSKKTLADFEFHHASQLKPDEIQALTAMVAMRSAR